MSNPDLGYCYELVDLDEDGDLDIVGIYNNSDVQWFENRDGDFFVEHDIKTGVVDNIEGVVVADFDMFGMDDRLEVINVNRSEDSQAFFISSYSTPKAREWTAMEDGDLETIGTGTTTLTGLQTNQDYYFKSWGVDIFNNYTTVADITAHTPASVPGQPEVSAESNSSLRLTIDPNNNSSSV